MNSASGKSNIYTLSNWDTLLSCALHHRNSKCKPYFRCNSIPVECLLTPLGVSNQMDTHTVRLAEW